MDLFQLREQFSRDGILMCFNGPFSHSIIEEIGIAIRNHLAAENIARMAVQDVFAVYIEMTQNARNYLARRDISPAKAGSATIVIARRDEFYSVTSGNVILNDDVELLRTRIDHIKAQAPDELKKLIRQQLRAEVQPGAMGAGIGLMEMAKRASGRLEYSVRPVDDRHSFFTLTAHI
ncbi:MULTISPECIES: SiaB family protein kinase [Geobacter]|uniref:SiaB family protein kinase n=1 Tax=Geobacter TaxID=28231 RepID=UPI0025735958|nr:SiaB family protein kinase [Geobacter sulfurreducens]BEH10464.1 SiaB family protein kinase [Geobacter sulfurreducens subsp. ethanolicus]BET57946.1 SiaB family protein kinase [Geobacter sp. 60473]